MFLAYGGSKHIKAATILELQPSAEGIGRKGKMADGDVGLAHALERLAQIALVHGGDAKDAKLATGEMGYGAIRKIQVGVGTDLGNAKRHRYLTETSRFHDAAIGYKQDARSGIGRMCRERNVVELLICHDS